MTQQLAVKTAPHLVRIEPRVGFPSLGLRELWEYRELMYFFVWRDVKVRYKQTVLGVTWAILQPVLTLLLFTVLFGRLAKLPSDGIPYPLFAYCALVPWQLFAFALVESSNSLVNNEKLLTKVQFPRMVIPIAAVLAGLVDFLLASTVLVGMLVWFHISLSPRMLLLPAFVLLAVATALAVGIWLSALNVEYRDVRYTVPFITQFWFFATPVAYSASLVPGVWRAVYGVNPMAGVVEGFRWALFGTGAGFGPLLTVSVAVVLLLLVSGAFYFKKMERTFADVI